MKILKNVEEIILKYNLKPVVLPEGVKNIYGIGSQDILKNYTPEINDDYLHKKYKDNITKGWYGFDIGTPIIPEWMKIIDEVIDLCIKVDYNFQIHQVKLKYGGIRFYVESVIEDINEVQHLIENTLYDKALIY